METINRNIELTVDWYEILSKLGYSVSDEEQKLLSGTHEEHQHV